MRIAVFAKRTSFHKNSGGLETSNETLVEGLVKRGYDVTVFSPKHELTDDSKEKNNVKYIFVPCKYKMGRFLGFFGSTDPENWVNKSYDYFLKENTVKKFDLILGQSSAAIGIIRKKKSIGIPIVSVSHGTIISEYRTYLDELGISDFTSPKKIVKFVFNTGYTIKNFFRRQRDFVHGSDKIIAVSNFVKSKLIEETFADENKITVVHNGIDPAKFTKPNTSASLPLKIIYVGRIEKSKGLQFLLQSLVAIENVHLTVIGDGPYLDYLKQLAEKFQLKKTVEFKGKMPYQTIPEELSNAHVFVLPTVRIEGFPMVIVEAMMAGLPAIVSDIGGNSDAIDDGVNGFLVKPGDITSLEEKINEFIQNPDKIASMGDSAFVKAHDNFTSDKMVDSYVKVFEEVLRK